MRFKFLNSKIRRVFSYTICLYSFFFQVLFLDTFTFAVVLKKSQVYEGPSKIYPKMDDLEEGSKIFLGQKSGKWYLITSPPQMRGWIEEEMVGKL